MPTGTDTGVKASASGIQWCRELWQRVSAQRRKPEATIIAFHANEMALSQEQAIRVETRTLWLTNHMEIGRHCKIGPKRHAVDSRNDLRRHNGERPKADTATM